MELRLPWQLLNFGNPPERRIHDDYYDNYGVEYIQIDELYAGLSLGDGAQGRIRTSAFPLAGWDKREAVHERLKLSYYMLQACWRAA